MLDENDRVLLLKIEDATVVRPDEPSPTIYWVTPGGSLEAGETHEDAARRELWEETGMEEISLGPWVALCEPILDWEGELIQAHDRFYLIRASTAAVTLSNMTDQERGAYRDHRWWTIEDLRASGEHVIPPGLVDLLERIIAGNLLQAPVRIT